MGSVNHRGDFYARVAFKGTRPLQEPGPSIQFRSSSGALVPETDEDDRPTLKALVRIGVVGTLSPSVGSRHP